LTAKIENSFFQCREEAFQEESILSYLYSGRFNFTCAIFIKSAQAFDMKSNTFFNCYHSDRGGVFRLEDSNFTDLSSEYYNNSAIQGGVIKATGSNIQLTESIFRYNYAQEGAVVQIDNDAQLRARKIKTEKNHATIVGGVFQVLTYSSLEIHDSLLTENYAAQASCLNIL
jgi:hypothetical protein